MARGWSMSQGTWDQLLVLLNPDRERAAEQYELLHRKLVRFFESRGVASPPDAADLTIDRVMRKIEAGEQIQDIGNYCYAIAKLISLEAAKQASRFQTTDEAALPRIAPEVREARGDVMRGCFVECLRQLPAEAQHLIIEYYAEDKSAKIEARRGLAGKLSVSLSGLRLRAHRIRARLESCIEGCMNQQKG
jgi:DNA-directed RNA polymerase specialized sigma24 family protein